MLPSPTAELLSNEQYHAELHYGAGHHGRVAWLGPGPTRTASPLIVHGDRLLLAKWVNVLDAQSRSRVGAEAHRMDARRSEPLAVRAEVGRAGCLDDANDRGAAAAAGLALPIVDVEARGVAACAVVALSA